MSIVNLIFNRSSPDKIDDIELDVAIREEHTYINDVTEYPIEDGSLISDHIRQQPVTLTIEGMTSNTPVGYAAGKLGAYFLGESSDRVYIMFSKLLALSGYDLPKQPGEKVSVYSPVMFDVVTGLRTYTNMVIKSITFPVASPYGRNALNYIIVMQEVRKIKLQSGVVYLLESVPHVKAQGAVKKSKGKVTPVELKESSLLKQGATALKGFLGL